MTIKKFRKYLISKSLVVYASPTDDIPNMKEVIGRGNKNTANINAENQLAQTEQNIILSSLLFIAFRKVKNKKRVEYINGRINK